MPASSTTSKTKPAHNGNKQPASKPAHNDHGQPVAEAVAGVVLLPVAVARRVLPERELPVYLGVGALAVVGIVDWPVAVAAGLGYAALKRWGPAEKKA